MNILLTLRQPLLPADTGGKVRSLNILRRLAKVCEVHAISFADEQSDAHSIAEMKEIFSSYTPVYWREKAKYSAGFYAQVLASQVGSWPYFLAKCNRPEFVAAVESLSHKHHFDLLFCDFLHSAAPLLNFPMRPKVIFQHNVEFLLRKRKWEVETNPIRKRIFRSEWQKTQTIEADVCRKFDHVLAVSDDDAYTMRQEFGVEHVSVLPTGVDTDFFKPTEEPESSPLAGRMVFVGSMDWDPNEDGVIWFLREVYPRIREANSKATFTVVGRSPSSRLREIAAAYPGVELTGTVPDVRPYLAEAEVVIVPLRVGGGTRIKIPEAMAMSKPVLSTTIGAEGLPFKVGREICIADDPEDFAETTLTLLGNQSLREAISAAARKRVVQQHGWDVVVDVLRATLNDLVSGQAAEPANEAAEVRV